MYNSYYLPTKSQMQQTQYFASPALLCASRPQPVVNLNNVGNNRLVQSQQLANLLNKEQPYQGGPIFMPQQKMIRVASQNLSQQPAVPQMVQTPYFTQQKIIIQPNNRGQSHQPKPQPQQQQQTNIINRLKTPEKRTVVKQEMQFVSPTTNVVLISPQINQELKKLDSKFNKSILKSESLIAKASPHKGKMQQSPMQSRLHQANFYQQYPQQSTQQQQFIAQSPYQLGHQVANTYLVQNQYQQPHQKQQYQLQQHHHQQQQQQSTSQQLIVQPQQQQQQQPQRLDPKQLNKLKEKELSSRYEQAINRSEQIIKNYLTRSPESAKKVGLTQTPLEKRNGQQSFMQSQNQQPGLQDELSQQSLFNSYSQSGAKKSNLFFKEDNSSQLQEKQILIRNYEDGSQYEGEINNDMRCGYGVLKNQQGQELYRGDWLDDLYHGSGFLYNQTPEQLLQEFDYRDFDKAKNCWVSYEGEFKLGLMSGYGTLILSNNEKLVGNFEEGKVNGKATFQKLDGQQFLGIWYDGKLAEEM